MTSASADDRESPAAAPPTAFRRRVTLLAVIGAGGAIGAAARYGTALAIPTHVDAYPLGTFLVNVVGTVILGAVVALPADWLAAHDLTRPAIGTGFCGGLTTFSTMSLEIYQRSAAHSTLAAVYAVTSLLAAPACAWAGLSLTETARAVLRKRRVGPGAAKGGPPR